MFSPLGYVSYKAAFDQLKAEWDWELLNLDEFFAVAFEENSGKISNYFAKRYSQDEVFERAFFSLMREDTRFLCSPQGLIMHLDAEFTMNTVWLPRLVDYKSYCSIPTDYFSDWSEHAKVIDAFSEAGKDPWSNSFELQKYSSVNLFYDRKNFLVDCSEYRELGGGVVNLNEFDPPATIEQVEPFEGWAFCTREAHFQSVDMQQLRAAIFKTIFEAFFGENTLASYLDPIENQKASVGRPEIKTQAAKAFLKHFQIGNHPPWKQVVKTLKDQEGIEVSSRSIQRGLGEISVDKKATKG